MENSSLCCVSNYSLKQLCTAVKNFIANVLKCKVHLQTIQICVRYYVFLDDESLLT